MGRAGLVVDREERRRTAYRLLQRRVPMVSIARELEVSYVTVWHWARRYRQAGPLSWRERTRPGAARRLSLRQQRTLLSLMRVGARSYGFPTERWTLRRTAKLIRQEYGVEYSLSGVWRLLVSLRHPRTPAVHPRPSPEKAYHREWAHDHWPGLA
jgi:transposase